MIEITQVEPKKNTIHFGNIIVGGTFKLSDRYYIKTLLMQNIANISYNCVNLLTGHPYSLEQTVVVIPQHIEATSQNA